MSLLPLLNSRILPNVGPVEEIVHRKFPNAMVVKDVARGCDQRQTKSNVQIMTQESTMERTKANES
jgi:hypothetical protein